MGKDVKEIIEEVTKKIKDNPKFMEELKADPVKAVEDSLGIDLPDQMAEPLVAGVKAKIESGDLGDALGKLGGLFGK